MSTYSTVPARGTRTRLLKVVAIALACVGAGSALAADPIFSAGFEAVPRDRSITLTPNGSVGINEQVNLGIPFAPGELTDAARVRILDAAGNEVAAFVKPTLRWHWLDNSIRAVKVQFFANPTSGPFTFDTSTPRTLSIGELPYDNGTRPGKADAPVPRVFATLSPAWLIASKIAGPQLAYNSTSQYDQYVDRQWQWAKDSSYTNIDQHAFLFDRASVIGFQYIRNGKPEWFGEFYNSATFYLSHIKTTGAGGGYPDCTGGWEYAGVEACDPKYSYVTPQLLLLGLAGDDTRLSLDTVRDMVENQMQSGWNIPLQPYPGGGQAWTERQYGLALTHIVAGYEITGDAAMRQNVEDVLGYLYDHQQTPPGDPYTGAWTHSWTTHECGAGCTPDPATDVRGASPWMSANIVGGLWKAWQVTSDPRIPTMLTSFGRYLEDYGWISDEQLASGSDWRSGCNAGGTISWYFSSAINPLSDVIAIQDGEGWYSDSHNPELLMAVAAARYFETDPQQRQAYDQRVTLINRYFNATCAAGSNTKRAFNWQHRNPEAVWLLGQ